MNHDKKSRKFIVIIVTIGLLLSCFAMLMAITANIKDHVAVNYDSNHTPSGETKLFSNGNLEFELSNVAFVRLENVVDDGGNTHELTVIFYYSGAKLSVKDDGICEPEYDEDGIAHPQWGIQLSTGEQVEIANKYGNLNILPSAEGIFNIESGQVVFRFKQIPPDRIEFENTEQFLETVLESSLFLDYNAVKTYDYQKNYGYEFASPNYLPESYTLYDRVFIRREPTNPNQIIIMRLWYDADSYNTLVISQFIPEVATSDYNGEFIFTSEDEMGEPMATWFPWATYRSSYEITNEKTGHVQGYMLVNDSFFKQECKNILTSIQ